MANATIDGKQADSLPASTKAKMMAGVPKRTAMSTTKKPVSSVQVK